MRAAWALVLLSSCTVSVSLEDKRCASSEPRCLPGYVCVDDFCVVSDGGARDGGADDGGSTDAGTTCPLDVDPAANACGGTTWYLAPSGSDSNDGRGPATPRLTIPATATRGDTVRLLGGTWAQAPPLSLGMSGNAACPFVVEGEADGGTVIEDTLAVEGAYLVFRHLVFSPHDASSVDALGTANHVTFQWCTFRSRAPSANSFPTDLFFNDACDDCVVRECSFESPDGVRPIVAGGARVAFRGNRVRVAQGAGPHFSGASPVVEGNDFTGEWNETPYLDFGGSTGARLSRNVFHDLSAFFPDKLLIGGPVRVSHNTFSSVVGNDNVPLVAVARFDNNLVTNSPWVVQGGAPDAGDWNLFDPSVARPYSDFDGGALPGSDRIAPVAIDARDVPLAGSAAIDAADPADAVPPGGGSRADVGARERGASPLPDGRYCLTDGGF